MADRRVGALIVDDEDDLRFLVRAAIKRHDGGLYVAGEAANGEAAIAGVQELDPDVVVLDQMMPGLDGLETARRILAVRPQQAIVLFTAFLDDTLRRAAETVGVRACMSKSQMKELPALLVEVTGA